MAKQNNYIEKYEELCAGYVLHALNPEERKEFEAMLREAGKEQQEFFRDLYSAAGQLAFTVKQHEPAGAVKERIFAHIRSGKDESTPSGVTDKSQESKTAFAIAASFALLIISLSLIFYSLNLSSRLGDKDGLIEKQQAQITLLQNEVQQKEELLSILEAREVDMILMAGMEANPNGYGKVIWDQENNRALLQVSNLPAIPSDKDYQLWIIKNNQPVSAGVFSLHELREDAFFKIEKMALVDEQSANAFAVTLEPKGGMPQPTGDTYLMGNMEGGQ